MKIIGHRGAKGLAPENTRAAIRKGLRYHVNEIEIDVRVTADGLTILLHDDHLKDLAGTRLEVKTHSFNELRQHKPDLISLPDALAIINRQVPVLLEVKPGVNLDPIVQIIKQHLQQGWQAKDFCLTSYSQPILLDLHAQLPDIQKAVIENWSGIRAAHRARQLDTRRLSMLELWLWSGFISSMKKRGYEIYSFPTKNPVKERFLAQIRLAGYTNNPHKIRKWVKSGLAGVITDYPDRFDK